MTPVIQQSVRFRTTPQALFDLSCLPNAVNLPPTFRG
jgi:hypothetical protein